MIKDILYYFQYYINKNKAYALPVELWSQKIKGSHLMIGGCSSEKISNTYGTPLHVVDKNVLFNTFRNFEISFREYYPNSNIYVSYKTNPVPGVLRMLHEFGAGAEAISPFEVWLALKLGLPPEKIIYNGPCKTDESLEKSIRAGLKLVNLDSFDELRRASAIAARLGKTQDVGIRIITNAGWSGQFGFRLDEDEPLEAFRILTEDSYLNPRGIHVHLGTGIQDLKTYRTAAREIVKLIEKIRIELNLIIDIVDIGGGFGIPTVDRFTGLDRWLMRRQRPPLSPNTESCPTYQEFAKCITDALAPCLKGNQIELLMEPGRALMSSAQVMLVRVQAVKKGSGKLGVLITDGGKNIAPTLVWENHQIYAANRMDEASTTNFEIYGPLCHPDDLLSRCRRLPALKTGDLLAVMDAGAYFIPNARTFSFPRPGIVAVYQGDHEWLRKRESFEHVVALDT